MGLKAVVVDKDYGSVSAEEMSRVCEAYKLAGIELEACHFTSEEALIEGCRGAMTILCTGNPDINRHVMESLPELRFIQRFGVGVNSIDLDAATELGKTVLFLPGFCAKELADLSAAMILSLVRNLGYYDREIRSGGWPKCQYLLPGDLRTMTLGLFGFGAAGHYLYQIMKGGFGMKVLSYDPYIPEAAKAKYPDVQFVSFDELLEQSDIISIHANLSPETHHIFNEDAFRKMKNTAMIINTSRGPIIDQKALAWALENGEILYAGLDTMEKEPIEKDDPLLKMDNVVFSPHSGSYGAGSKLTQINMVCSLVPNAVTNGTIPRSNIANKAVIGKDTGYTVA